MKRLKKLFKVFDSNAPTSVRLYSLFKLLFPSVSLVGGMFVVVMLISVAGFMTSEEETVTGSDAAFTGQYSRDLPIFEEIKGTDNIPDEVAQLAVGTAVKYRLLPSVILSQWAYESEWGRSYAAQNDNNYFGITWFAGCPFPRGSPRGVGGSEGGWYMQFPDMQSSFSYYGYMVATQSNFNKCVSNKNPDDCLLILGRGGYAAAGITEASPYFINCMSIIRSNQLVEKYDGFAIEHWESAAIEELPGPGQGDITVLESVLGQTVYNGQCYGMTAYYVDKMGGPVLMGSGFSYASQIGSDYAWGNFGWKVINNPDFKDFQAGDVINYHAFSSMGPTMYGHTGVIANVGSNGQYLTYEQNAEQGQIVAKYSRIHQSGVVSSIIRKVK